MMLLDSIPVDEGFHGVVVDELDLVYFVAGAIQSPTMKFMSNCQPQSIIIFN